MPRRIAIRRAVASRRAALAANNSLSVVAGNDIAGDPAYGHVKQLRVDYTLGGHSGVKTAKEGETVRIPGDGDAPGRLVIRSAVYGVLGEPLTRLSLATPPSEPPR